MITIVQLSYNRLVQMPGIKIQTSEVNILNLKYNHQVKTSKNLYTNVRYMDDNTPTPNRV